MSAKGLKRVDIIIPIVAVTIIVWLVYLNSINNSFHYDDRHSIVNNMSIRSLSNVPRFFLSPSTFSDSPLARMYRPVLLVSYAINYAIGGLDVTGFHLLNILLHNINVVLIYLILRYFVGLWGAFTSALFFGILPLNSQAVNYISSRSVSLVTLFYLISFYTFIKSTRESEGRPVSLTFAIYYTIAIIAYLLGLLSKEIAITLPLLLIVFEYLFKRDNKDESHTFHFVVIYHIPFWLISSIYLLLRKHLFGKAVIDVSKVTLLEGRGGIRSVYSSILTQSKVILLYLKEMFYPFGISLIHDMRVVNTLFDFQVIISLVLIASIVLFAWKIRGKYPLCSFGILWFFIALLPETILPLNLIVNEHRAYLPGVGIAFCMGEVLDRLTKKESLSTSLRYVLIIILAGFFIMNTVVTVKRNTIWKDDYTLFSDTVKKAPNSASARYSLGLAYMRDGRFDKAFVELQHTIDLNPSYYEAYAMLGIIFFEKGEYERGIENFKKAIILQPKLATAHYDLGVAYFELGRYKEAEDSFRRAIRMKPNFVKAYIGLGTVLELRGDRDNAYEAFRKALLIDPSNKEAEKRIKALKKEGNGFR